MTRKRIAIDMDEVIADVMPKFLKLYEQAFGHQLQPDAYRGKKIYHLPGAYKIRESLFDPGFFADLPVIPGSQEGIQTLQEKYDVFIVTAAMEFRNSLADKRDWLERYFPTVPWKNIIMCGDKSIIGTDYMIDDHPFNLEAFQGKGLLYTAMHNLDETRFHRVHNWAEIVAFFAEE